MIHFPRIFGVGNEYPPYLYHAKGSSKPVKVVIIRTCMAQKTDDGRIFLRPSGPGDDPVLRVVAEEEGVNITIIFDPPLTSVFREDL